MKMIMYKKVIAVFVVIVSFITNNSSAGTFLSQNNFIITPEFQAHIKISPFNLIITEQNGKKFKVYLYAEDERSERDEYYPCFEIEKRERNTKMGHYYLYLYDLQLQKFLPTRTPVFSAYDNDIRLNTQGSMFFSLTTAGQNRKEIIFLSQFISCDGNEYEAYGLSKDQSHLEHYKFIDNKVANSFYGKIRPELVDNNIYAYTLGEGKTFIFNLLFSNMPRAIQKHPIPLPRQ